MNVVCFSSIILSTLFVGEDCWIRPVFRIRWDRPFTRTCSVHDLYYYFKHCSNAFMVCILNLAHCTYICFKYRFEKHLTVCFATNAPFHKISSSTQCGNFLWSCEGLWRGLSLCVSGMIVTGQYNHNLLD